LLKYEKKITSLFISTAFICITINNVSITKHHMSKGGMSNGLKYCKDMPCFNLKFDKF